MTLSFEGVREVKNDITAFIDASNVYGSSAAEGNKLRNGGTDVYIDIKIIYVIVM